MPLLSTPRIAVLRSSMPFAGTTAPGKPSTLFIPARAFGVGVDRLALLKYGMDDLRAFFDGDVRWLRHYGFSPFDQPTLSAGVGARA